MSTKILAKVKTCLTYCNNSNKLEVGKIKTEITGVVIEEFVRLKPQMYSYLVDNILFNDIFYNRFVNNEWQNNNNNNNNGRMQICSLKKKMPKYIIEDIEISSDKSDKEDSDEENHIEE